MTPKKIGNQEGGDRQVFLPAVNQLARKESTVPPRLHKEGFFHPLLLGKGKWGETDRKSLFLFPKGKGRKGIGLFSFQGRLD